MTTLILPVIHHVDAETTHSQAALAMRCGADGVFLISHDGADSELPGLGQEVVARAAGRRPFVGINMLNTNPVAALARVAEAGLDAVWIDAPGIDSNGAGPAGKKLADLASKHPQVAVFASIAFKYQPEEANPSAAAACVRKLGMLPTTSGPGTGVPPTVAKIEAMSAAAGGALAVASGMTPANVQQYAPLLSHILVATGVSCDEHHFDEGLLREFVAAARSAQLGREASSTGSSIAG